MYVTDKGPEVVPRLLESLQLSLPNILRNITLHFDANWNQVFAEDDEARWRDFDTALTSPRFPNLTYVEIVWGMNAGMKPLNWERSREHLLMMHRRGIFPKFLPGLYKRGHLWCDSYDSSRVYNVTESALASEAESFGSNTLCTFTYKNVEIRL